LYRGAFNQSANYCKRNTSCRKDIVVKQDCINQYIASLYFFSFKRRCANKKISSGGNTWCCDIIIASADLPCFKRLPFIEEQFPVAIYMAVIVYDNFFICCIYNAVKFAVLSCADCKASGAISPELKSKEV
jgi:hypothetical protein